MAPKSKKMKVDQTSSSRTSSLRTMKKDGVTTSTSMSTDHVSQNRTSSLHTMKKDGVTTSASMSTDHVSPNRTSSLHTMKKDGVTTSTSMSTHHVPQTSDIHLRIQQAKNYAVAQAQQEGCMSNFRIFDSPFGNFLVPAIPTRSDLGGGNLEN